MKAQTRVGLALAGIVVLIAAAALVNGLAGKDAGDTNNGDGPSADVTVPPTGGTTGETTKPDAGPLLKAGSVKVIRVSKGETVRFRAVSDVADELHVHGYDRTVRLPAGKTVEVRFKADLDGVFEIEMHHAGGHVGELRVDP